MADVTKFIVYDEGSEKIENEIQPRIPFRSWFRLDTEEKLTALQELHNNGWLNSKSENILITASYLNDKYLKRCPCPRLHKIPPKYNYSRYGDDNRHERLVAAYTDLHELLLSCESEALVLVALSRLAKTYISQSQLDRAQKGESTDKKEELIKDAYDKFDRFANCLNHIFEQFSVNQRLTRTSLIPRQENKITEEIYEPVLRILADPKWKTLNVDIEKMFGEFRDGNYPEVITKVHGVVHRFLQILVGEEGKSGKGEVGKLYSSAIKEGKIPVSRFTESMVKSIQSFIVAERANKSTAKPAKEDASPEDALLNMNVLMVFLQHCLQGQK